MYVVYKRMYHGTCMHNHWKPLNRSCAWSGYGPGCTTVKFPQTLYRSVIGLSLFCVKQTQTLNSEDLFYIILKYLCILVKAVAQWLRCCATNRKVAGSIPASVSGFFIDIKYFRSHYGPWVDSASNRNEYQKHFLGIKAAGA